MDFKNEIMYSYTNNNKTFMKIKVGKQIYTIMGYSRAALKTSIMILEINTVFDMGYMDEQAFAYDNKVVSHGHGDHIGSLPSDHCARRFAEINKDKLYVMPEQCIEPYKMIASAFSEMNSGRSGKNIKMISELVDTILISSEKCDMIPLLYTGPYYVQSVLMDHKVKSYGYIIYMKSNRLKPEFVGLTGIEIKKKKEELGKDNLTYVHMEPMVAYTGDTTIAGVLRNNTLLNVPLLIMECTGFDMDDRKTTREGYHIHFSELIENHEKFMNEKII
jgi:ribonuclease Z